VAADAAVAVQAARTPPGCIATLILPADTAWNDGAAPAPSLRPVAPAPVAPDVIRSVAALLRPRPRALIMLAGAALAEPGLRAAQRIAVATGVRLLTPVQVSRMARGRGRPAIDRLPYPVDRALEVLKDVDHLVLCGAKPPVGFFAYPGKPSTMWPKEAALHVLARPEQDLVAALESLAEELDAPRDPAIRDGAAPSPVTGRFTPEAFGTTLAALMPENAIVAEDAVTSGRGLFPLTFGAPPHDWLQITGGAIGCAFPLATGAAVACQDRKVICLQADGGGMYTLQSLWTQARERLDVINIIFANRAYAILRGELTAVGATPGRASTELFDIGRPDLDWIALARGMGVEGARAPSLDAFADLFRAACAKRGPFLIELAVP
jgi:acetolactate synthase-1/2/3 large subunit